MAKELPWKKSAKKRVAELKKDAEIIEDLLDVIDERGELIDALARKVEELEDKLASPKLL